MTALFGLAQNESQAQQVVDLLLKKKFSNSEISILLPEHLSRMQLSETNGVKKENQPKSRHIHNFVKDNITTEVHTKAPEGAAIGATAGGILGGSIGLLAGIGALAIPGAGAFIASGPILGALSGSAIGGSLGLLVGTLVGYGIPEYEAKQIEEGVRSGNILIIIHTANPHQLSDAKAIMSDAGIFNIYSSEPDFMPQNQLQED